MSSLRVQYATEWTERREREAALLEQRQAQWRMSKASAKALGARARAERMSDHSNRQDRLRRARTVRQEMSRRRQSMWLLQVDRRRQAWLNELEANSQEWILEEDIDERISPELFSEMRIPWQFEDWFAGVARARAKAEAHLRHTSAVAAAEAAGEDGEGAGTGAVELSEWEQDLDGWVSDGTRTATLSPRGGVAAAGAEAVELEDDIEPAELVAGLDRRSLRQRRILELRDYATRYLMDGEAVLGPDAFSVVPAELVEEAGEDGLIDAAFFTVPEGGGPDSAEEAEHLLHGVRMGSEDYEDGELAELLPALLRDADGDDPSLTSRQAVERCFALLAASPIGPRFVARARELAAARAVAVDVTGSGTNARGVFRLDREGAALVAQKLGEEFLPQLEGVEEDAHMALLSRWVYRSLDAVGLTTAKAAALVAEEEAEEAATKGGASARRGREAAGTDKAGGSGGGEDGGEEAEEGGEEGGGDMLLSELHRAAVRVSQVTGDASLVGDKLEPWAEGQLELADAVLDSLADGNLLGGDAEAQRRRLDPAGRFSRLAAPFDSGPEVLAGTVDIERGLPWELDATADPEAADEWLRLVDAAHEAGRAVSEQDVSDLRRRLVRAHHSQQLEQHYRHRRGDALLPGEDALPPAEVLPTGAASDAAARVRAASALARGRRAEAVLRREAPFEQPAVPFRPGPFGALEPAPGVLPLLVDDALDLAEETAIYEAHAAGNTEALRRLLDRRTRRLQREAPEVLARYDLDAPYRAALRPGASPAKLGNNEKAADTVAVDPASYDEEFSLFSDDDDEVAAPTGLDGEPDERG